ncbi:MAG: hypothetical protein A2039_01010 [Candidatus Melainabacteria bacterium GWA2_34_9]|nr:MAG: hypothetical protein A2039_01010 [Candidatus Melainabacteria bacterium GWA2_34_9]
MQTTDKIPATPKIVGGAIDRTLSERSEWLKKYYNLFKTSAEELSTQEKQTLLFSLNESERNIHKTSKKLKNLESLFIRISPNQIV